MSIRLPIAESTDLPTEPTQLVAKLSDLLANASLQQGYVRLQTPDDERFLFMHQGRVFCAGALVDDRFLSLSVVDFFRGAMNATVARFCSTDLALFLCTTVLFRKQPVARIPSDIIDSESLLKHIRSTGRDAVVAINRDDARSLVFCRQGEPAALYAAPGEEFPNASSLADQIVKYVFKDMTYRGTSLAVFDEIKLPPSDDAGQPLSTYIEAARTNGSVEPGPAPNLLVCLGERVVERVAVSRQLKLGRETDNDVVLNNLSVSRHHAVVTRQGNKLLVEDLGSQNGVTFRGQKVESAELGPGDEIILGKYKIVYARDAGGAVEPARPISSPSGPAVEQTMALMSGKAVPIVEHDGEQHKVKGLVFTIGKDANAHIRIGGLFVAPIHVRIFREPAGSYRVEHVGGRRALRVNGRPVKQATLSNGDEMLIGSHQFRFTVPGEGGAPEPSSDVTVLGPGN